MYSKNDLIESITEAKRTFGVLLAMSDIKGTKGSCLFSCIFLKGWLEKFTPCENIQFKGGDTDSGVLIDGKWEGHYWIEAELEGSTWIFDLTIDQFYSGLPFVCSTLDELDITYKDNPESDALEHARELMPHLNL